MSYSRAAVEVGRAVRLRRRVLGITQAQFGRMLLPPLSRSSVSELERGKTAVAISRSRNIAAVLGLEQADLLGAVQREGLVEQSTDND